MTSPAQKYEHKSGRRTILLIEDNHADARLIEIMLAEAGEPERHLTHATRLEEGLQQLVREKAEVVLLDLSLPDSAGLPSLQLVQERAPQTPVIVLTGSRDRSLALRALQEGAQDYLIKDEVTGPSLLKAINYAIERKQAESRLRESESRYRGLISAVPDAILLLRDGRIVDCNQRAEPLFGHRREELLGLTPGTLSPPRQPDGSVSAETFRAWVGAVAGGQPQWFEWRFQRADGSFLAAEVILDGLSLNGEPHMLVIVRDLTERKQAEERIRFQASLLNQVQNAVVATDLNDNIIYWNNFAGTLLQWDYAEALGRPLTTLVVPPHDQGRFQDIRATLKREWTWEGEIELMRRDGSRFPALMTLSAVRDGNDDVTGYVGIASDISERKEVERKLEHNAFHDTLTGLPNRALLNERLAGAIARGSREGGRYAVLMMDLDRFKVVNDSLGHLVGDELLIQFARRVESCLRPGDTLARLGGDEFTILLEDVEHTSDAIRVAERIHEKMAQPFLLGHNEVYTSTSIGIAFGSANYRESSQAVRDADIAMYRAKKQGKGCHVIFEAGMHDRAISQLKRETRIRRAIEQGEFGMNFQPILDLTTGRCVGAESLVRWQHPAELRAAPLELITLAEETGLIIPLGQQLLADACRQLQRWQSQYDLGDGFKLHINLSVKQFCHRGLVSQITQALRDHDLEGRQLVLEITEAVLMEHPVLAAAMLGDLRDLGLQICIDDFGTGCSSLSYLHQFPLDALKIDRSFVHGLGQNTASTAIARAIVGLGESLGMRTIATGVERALHRDELVKLGCRYAQGFLLQAPLAAQEMDQFLATA